MERIVVEVDVRLARAWRKASDKKKREIENKFNISLAKELMKPTSGETDEKISEYLAFLGEVREKMSSKGLTQEELNEIINND